MFKHNALFLCRENIDIGSNARWSKVGQVRDCVPKDNFLLKLLQPLPITLLSILFLMRKLSYKVLHAKVLL